MLESVKSITNYAKSFLSFRFYESSSKYRNLFSYSDCSFIVIIRVEFQIPAFAGMTRLAISGMTKTFKIWNNYDKT